MTMRRVQLRTTFCRAVGTWGLVLLATAMCLAAPAARADQPAANVLFVFTDDQRADTIGALGNPHIRTPNLDRLVRSGFALTNAYCMGSTMAAVCLPSRTMLLSGMSLFRLPATDPPHTMSDWKPPGITWPQRMRSAGYETYHHGKRGNVPLSIQSDFEHNRYLEFTPGTYDETDRTSGHPGRPVADGAIEFLRERDRGRPFFMYLAFSGPHDPWVVQDEYRQAYATADLPLPRNFLPFHPFDNGELLVRDEHLSGWPRTPQEIRDHLASYYGIITYMDEQIGRVLQALRDIDQYENTIIVFSSDHGLALGSHGLMGKQSLYEHSMKAPLIFSGPGIPHGRSDALAYLHDLYPTLCELVGLDAPAEVDGRSLAPVIRGDVDGVRDVLFTAYRDVQRAVRDERWKLIRYPRIHKTQLFDLREDPDELHDLADDPAYAGQVDRLMAELMRQQAGAGDRVPLSHPQPHPAAVDLDYFRLKSAADGRGRAP